MKSEAITLKNTWKSFKSPFRSFISTGGAADKLLLFVSIGLAAFGLVMVYSASYIFSQEKFGDGLHYFNRHLVFLSIGLMAMTVCRFIRFEIWEKYAGTIFILALVLMSLTLVPGFQHKVKGGARWVNLGAITVQPVEFAKIALIILLAKNLTRPNLTLDGWISGFLVHLWPTVLMIFFCMLQSDFGSSALAIAVSVLLLYLAGVKRKYILGSVMLVLPFTIGAIAFTPYRRARLLTFLDPWADPQGAGFQVIQSFIAFHRGGLFGVGLGNSKAKIFYLPEAHNDFILSVVGEELGFLGIGILSISFLLLVFRGIRVAAKAKSDFAAILASGLTILVGLEIFWNASVVLGLFPNKGMNLPFISSGGSSIICALAIVGILLNISSDPRSTAKVAQKREFGL